jgi:hypothetical protein
MNIFSIFYTHHGVPNEHMMTVETNFIQIMCEKRDRSTPEVSVFGSKNSVHPW